MIPEDEWSKVSNVFKFGTLFLGDQEVSNYIIMYKEAIEEIVNTQGE